MSPSAAWWSGVNFVRATAIYELAGRVQRRRGAQDWSLDPVTSRWRGSWRIAVVAPGPRDAAERAGLRDSMRRLRCSELRAGTWTRPDNLPRASAPAESWKIADAQCHWWSGRPDGDPAEVASELFDDARWARRAVTLGSRLESVTRALAGSDDGAIAEGFAVGAASLAHLRGDPLLPPELAADAAAGDALRHAYRSYEGAFSQALHAWFVDR